MLVKHIGYCFALKCDAMPKNDYLDPSIGMRRIYFFLFRFGVGSVFKKFGCSSVKKCGSVRTV